MNIYSSEYFIRRYKKVTKNNLSLKQKIKIRLDLFLSNPTHPALKLHKLKGKLIEDWSIAIEDNLRIVFTYVKDGILLVDIGSHDQVY